jgi:hypothetical protein
VFDLHSKVPGLMLQALNILFKASPQEVVGHLPIAMGRIQEIARACTDEVNSVLNKYNKVIATLEELQIASLVKQVKVKLLLVLLVLLALDVIITMNTDPESLP